MQRPRDFQTILCTTCKNLATFHQMFTNSSERGKIENFWQQITNFDEFCQFYNALNSLVWRLHVQRVNAFAHIHKTQCFPGSLFDDYSNAQFSSRLSDWGEIYVSTWLHSKEMSQTAWSRGKDCTNSTLCIVPGSVADDYSSAQFSHETKQPQGHSPATSPGHFRVAAV